MLSMTIPWKVAKESELKYKTFLENRQEFFLFDKYGPETKELLVC
jgi:hypothetical protein